MGRCSKANLVGDEGWPELLNGKRSGDATALLCHLSGRQDSLGFEMLPSHPGHPVLLCWAARASPSHETILSVSVGKLQVCCNVFILLSFCVTIIPLVLISPSICIANSKIFTSTLRTHRPPYSSSSLLPHTP